jgi:hypothetical protein
MLFPLFLTLALYLKEDPVKIEEVPYWGMHWK